MKKPLNRLILLSFFLFCFSPITSASELYQEGLLLLSNKNYLSAVDYFKEKTSHEPQNAAAHFYLGYSYYKAGKPAFAVSKFKKTFLLNPNFSPGEIADESLNIIINNIKKNKKDFLIVTAKQEDDSPNELYKDKKELEEVKPEAENLFRKGLISIYRKDYLKAEKQFRELIENNNKAKYHYYLGYVLYAEKQMDEALKEFQASYSIDPAFNPASLEK